MGAKASGARVSGSDSAANLGAAQLREVREAFQVLDRDNDGLVNRDDVADALANVGKYRSYEIIFLQEDTPGKYQFLTCHGGTPSRARIIGRCYVAIFLAR